MTSLQASSGGRVTRLLTIGFASAAAMWVFSYLAMLQPGMVGGEVLFGCSIAALLAGGVIAGRTASTPGTGVVDGVLMGTIVAAINLLLVASLIRSALAGGTVWIVGILLGCVVVATIGACVGGLWGRMQVREHWASLFCWVATALTFFMIVTGGIVTGFESGLAVPDWPNSYGHNMLLYPLSEMVADHSTGIFYEHAHRLTGMFVGLTSITMLCVVWKAATCSIVRWMAVAILVMVIGQGVLGGLRVTGVLTFSQDPSILAPSTGLAIVHGVFAHIVMAVMALTATSVSRRWCDGGPDDGSSSLHRTMTIVLVIALVVQLAIGAAYRHLAGEPAVGPRDGQAMALLMVHVTLAVAVAILAIAVGLQGSSMRGVLRTLGVVLLAVVVLQLLLGVGAVVGVYAPDASLQGTQTPAWAVLLTSMHQANGALLLMAAAVTAGWARHLRERA